MATQNYTTSYDNPTSNVKLLEGKKILAYPLDLGSSALDKYGTEEQFMMIRINTDQKTTRLKNDDVSGAVVVSTNRRQGIGLGNHALNGNITHKTDDSAMRILHGDKAVDAEPWVIQKGMVRLDKVIVLPMPMEHSVQTSLTYNDQFESTNLTILGDMMNNNAVDTIGGVASRAKNYVLTKIVNGVKSGMTNEQAMRAEDRQALNPKKEVMYEGFGFRSFTFTYQFAPRSLKESDTVRDIIETLRYYALPELQAGKVNYIFPAEFELSFMLGQKDNPYIPKIGTSVLRRVGVNYMPNSVWSSLPNGAPLSLSLSLDFLEMELIDRTRVFNPNSVISSGY